MCLRSDRRPAFLPEPSGDFLAGLSAAVALALDKTEDRFASPFGTSADSMKFKSTNRPG